MDNDIELTELVDLDVERQDGVAKPASGFTFLVKKSADVDKEAEHSCDGTCCDNCGSRQDAAKDVNAVGGIDEQPDIDCAEMVLCHLYKLLEMEAREGAIGAHEECDVNVLTEAISLIRYFICMEQMGAEEDDGSNMAKAEAELNEFVVAKAHRKFSSDERKRLASEGKALEDGSYPIPDADGLRRAAILARSGHGDVAAAKRLIAKRARELGVPNPLAEEAKKNVDNDNIETPDEAEVTKTETEPTTDEPQSVAKADFDALTERVVKMESALAEATEQRDEAVAGEAAAKSELEALKATPIPGGPALAATAADRDFRANSERIAKAAYFNRQADVTSDRELANEYRKRAAALNAEAE